MDIFIFHVADAFNPERQPGSCIETSQEIISTQQSETIYTESHSQVGKQSIGKGRNLLGEWLESSFFNTFTEDAV